MTLQIQLTDEEARLVAEHLSWRLRQLDAELARSDRRDPKPELEAEAGRLRALTARFAPPEPQKDGPWADQFTDGEGDLVHRHDLAGI